MDIAIKIRKRYQGRVFQKDNHLINERIKAPKLLVIDQHGHKLGVLPNAVARKKAQESELDLVLISSKPEIPVVKIIDYGKFRYERKKREHEVKKNQKVVENKEIRISPNIGIHDLKVKIKNTRKFLEKGSRVKISLAFKGRQMANKEIGYKTMKNFLLSIEDIANVDRQPKLHGRFYDAYVSPK